MKNDQYLKLEVSLFNTESVEQLVDRLGMAGWGIYVALLMKMRMNDDLALCGSEASVAAMARRWRVTPQEVIEVLHDGELFVPLDEDPERFSSPYLDRVMAALWMKRGDVLRGEKSPRKRTVKRAGDGRFTVNATIEEKTREEQTTVEEETVVVAAAPVRPSIRPWQSLVDEMEADESWMEMVGLHSGLGRLFIDHRPEVVAIFKAHIRLYDKGGGLLRINDVRQYFANFMAAGSRTCQGVRQKLMERLRSAQKEALISPYETVVEGRRMYLGHPIPDDAPPRPDEFAVWDEEAHRWTR